MSIGAAPVVGVVDANSHDRTALAGLLRRQGVRVVAYESAERFQRDAGAPERLVCLIVALPLPGISGVELLRWLRGKGASVPVVVLAQDSDVETAVEAMREGASDFIEKPYTNASVLKRVRRLLHDPLRESR